MNEYIEALQELAKQLKTFVDKRIKRAKFDRTVQGRITEVMQKNKCKALIDGKEFNVKTKTTHSVNEVVDICIPQNNLNKMFVIPNSITSGGGNLEGDTKDCIVSFTEPSENADVISGDTHSTIVGKFLKNIKTIRTHIGILTNLGTESKSNLVSSINEVNEKANLAFQSASNGKQVVKTAITGKDESVLIPEEATFQQLADCIAQIKTGIDTSDATATAEYILAGLTAYIDNLKVIGTMPNIGPETAEIIDLTVEGAEYTIAKGFHSGLRKIRAKISGLVASVIKSGTKVGGITGTFTSDATAVAGDILSGKTAYKNGSKLTGTMVDRGTVNHTLPINGSYTIPSGKHSGTGKVTQAIATKGAQTFTPGTADQIIASGQYLSGVQTILGDANLIPANILKDKEIFGVKGILTPGASFATGISISTTSGTTKNFSYNSGSGGVRTEALPYLQVTGLSLPSIPKAVICMHYVANNLIAFTAHIALFGDLVEYSIIKARKSYPYHYQDFQMYRAPYYGADASVTANGFLLPAEANKEYVWWVYV